jgi:serine/threonine protein phosphatase PrpC
MRAQARAEARQSATVERVSEVAHIEEAVTRLAREGRAAFVGRATRLRVDHSTAAVCGFTQSAWHREDDERPRNTDNVLVANAVVGSREALVLAVAHGNYKDEGCYLASATAVCELQDELAEPLLSEADIVPALRRAFLRAGERIVRLERTERPSHPLGTAVGARRNLKGIGASLLAIVVVSGFAWVAHVGENRGLLVRDGRAGQLVLPHTLANAPAYRAGRVSEFAGADDVVLRVLGCGQEIMPQDVLRTPVSPGARLILGNAGLGAFHADADLAWWIGDAQEVVERFARASIERCPHLPPTLLVADLR